MKPCATREGKATVCVEEVAVLAEVRAEFALSWTALELFDRGAPALDTGPAENAAREVALAEDRIVFYGEPVGHGLLISKESPTVTTQDWAKPGQAVTDVLHAVERLDSHGIGGPSELVLAPAPHHTLLQGTQGEGRHPRSRHLRDVIAGAQRSHLIR